MTVVNRIHYHAGLTPSPGEVSCMIRLYPRRKSEKSLRVWCAAESKAKFESRVQNMSEALDKLLLQALQARRENRSEDAKKDLTEAVALSRLSGVQADLAKALTSLGQIERDMHRNDAAQQHYEEAVAIYRTQPNPLGLAHTVRHLGDILRNQGRLDLAAPCYEEALAIYRGHRETPPLDLANAIRGYALLKEGCGEKTQAASLWEEAGKLYADVHVMEGVAESSRRVALLAGNR
jgi:tetratricopeptide (TPR) repeat protein